MTVAIPDWPGTFKCGYIVRRNQRAEAKRWPEAWFAYAPDAEWYRQQQTDPERFEIVDQESGRKVVGTNGHGNAILEILRRKGEL